MTDDILKDLLSDILQQQAAILKLVKEIKVQQNIIPAKPEKLDKHVPVVDDSFNLFANKFFAEFDRGLKQLMALSALIPTEINSIRQEETKIVLFSKNYEEGNYGAKDLLKSLYVFLGICFGLFLLVKYIPSYLGSKDENLAYKNTVHWYYFKSDKKNRDALLKTVNQFMKGDTSYVNELNRYIENAKILKHD